MKAISAGGEHSLALKVGGSVVAWGNNSSGQLNVPAGLNLKLKFKVPGKAVAPVLLQFLLS